MEELKKLLNQGLKEESLKYVLDKLNNGTSIIDLYDNYLFPILRNLECELNDVDICTWKEHIKTSIVRTIVENVYPYVVKNKKENSNKVSVVICPPEENYDIEARMYSDYLTLLGFETIFVGANTPYTDFYNVVSVLKPDLLLICVNNYYNIVSTNKIIEDIKGKLNEEPTILVSGNAFINKKDMYKTINADYLINNYHDLELVVENI